MIYIPTLELSNNLQSKSNTQEFEYASLPELFVFFISVFTFFTVILCIPFKILNSFSILLTLVFLLSKVTIGFFSFDKSICFDQDLYKCMSAFKSLYFCTILIVITILVILYYICNPNESFYSFYKKSASLHTTNSFMISFNIHHTSLFNKILLACFSATMFVLVIPIMILIFSILYRIITILFSEDLTFYKNNDCNQLTILNKHKLTK